ncbi:hypothetical protein JCM3775_003566 [Rhodotorula graminis]
MDDLITLRTSDDPPVELKAARSVLVAGSKVFSDMLSLPQRTTTSEDGAIDVAETDSELSPFLRLLNLSHDEGNPLEELKVDDWPVVARLADKYDSATVKGLALGMYWKWRSADSEHVASYRTAAALSDKTLAKFSLFRLLQDGQQEMIDAALQGRKDELDVWIGKLKLHAFEHSLTDLYVTNSPFCSGCLSIRVTVQRPDWDSAMRSSMARWTAQNAGAPFHRSITGCAESREACASCRETAGPRFDQAYRDSAPDFPL